MGLDNITYHCCHLPAGAPVGVGVAEVFLVVLDEVVVDDEVLVEVELLVLVLDLLVLELLLELVELEVGVDVVLVVLETGGAPLHPRISSSVRTYAEL